VPSPVEVKVRVVMVTDQMAQAFDDIVRRLERIELAQRPWWQRLLGRAARLLQHNNPGMSGGDRY
jgi:hypothetical protein